MFRAGAERRFDWLWPDDRGCFRACARPRGEEALDIPVAVSPLEPQNLMNGGRGFGCASAVPAHSGNAGIPRRTRAGCQACDGTVTLRKELLLQARLQSLGGLCSFLLNCRSGFACPQGVFQLLCRNSAAIRYWSVYIDVLFEAPSNRCISVLFAD